MCHTSCMTAILQQRQRGRQMRPERGFITRSNVANPPACQRLVRPTTRSPRAAAVSQTSPAEPKPRAKAGRSTPPCKRFSNRHGTFRYSRNRADRKSNIVKPTHLGLRRQSAAATPLWAGRRFTSIRTQPVRTKQHPAQPERGSVIRSNVSNPPACHRPAHSTTRSPRTTAVSQPSLPRRSSERRRVKPGPS